MKSRGDPEWKRQVEGLVGEGEEGGTSGEGVEGGTREVCAPDYYTDKSPSLGYQTHAIGSICGALYRSLG